jgi:hypothetical protein
MHSMLLEPVCDAVQCGRRLCRCMRSVGAGRWFGIGAEKDEECQVIHNDVPVGGADEAGMCGGVGPDEYALDVANPWVRDAYWCAARLIDVGWAIRCVGSTEQGGFFEAETPRRRVVSVDECAGPGGDPAVQFAKSITTLVVAGAAEGRDYLRDLVRLLSDSALVRRSATLRWRTWDIPGLPAHLQPLPKIRAAYWFAVTLTDDYGWKLFEIGRDTAAGGFIADIPGEIMAVYPGSMADDRTAASALARLLGSMSANDAEIVASLVDLTCR